MKTKLLRISLGLLLSLAGIANVLGITNSTGPDKKNDNTFRGIDRSIRKETRDLKRDGYDVEVGAPGIEWQLRNSYEKEFQLTEDGNNRFIVGVGSAIAGIQNVARRHAASDAQIDACTQLESRIMGLIENDYNNKLYSRKEYETLSRMKGVFSNVLAQTLPVGSPICTFSRDNGKTYDYQLRIAYPVEMLAAKSKQVINDLLGKENDDLRKKMESITGLDRLGSSSIEK